MGNSYRNSKKETKKILLIKKKVNKTKIIDKI